MVNNSERISPFALLELKYYCYQYPEKIKQGKSTDIALIEQTAMEAGPEIYVYLLRAVTSEKSYLNLKMMQNIPCGKNYFYDRRTLFYYLLAKKKGIV